MAEGVPSMHGFDLPLLCKTENDGNACNLSMRKVWVGESEVQSHPQPLCEFKASLGCLVSKGNKKEGVGGTERGRNRVQ